MSTPPSAQTSLIPNEDLESIYAVQHAESLQWFVPSQKQYLAVPRWIPTCVTEVFFEGDRKGIKPDIDEMGLVTNILHCLARLPNHVRAGVIQGIVIVGGGAAIPGLRTRLRNDLARLWDAKLGTVGMGRSTTPDEVRGGGEELSITELAHVKGKSALRFLATSPLEATFLGGSMLGDIKVKGFTEVTRDEFNSSRGRAVVDWSFIGGVGDAGVEGKRRSHG